MLQHGINTFKNNTNFSETGIVSVGVPVYIGCWPCHHGQGYKGVPQIAYSFEEAVEIGGYSDEWRDGSGNPKWNLCQAMYCHFNEFQVAPAVFYNVFDPATHKTAVASASVSVVNKIAKLPFDALIDSGLEVKLAQAGDALVLDTDYKAYYTDDGVEIEMLTNTTIIAAYIAYNKANLAAITATDIIAALEKLELCKATIGVVPDLLCAPGWSSTPTVASAMATKAGNINGLFKGKAVVDISTAAAAADAYDDVAAYKNANGYTEENMIVCWPLVKIGDKLYDYSTVLCGLIATVDYSNESIPFESPSNKKLPITAAVNAAGAEVNMTVAQADVVSVTAGVVTVLNFDGWRAWGNYTGHYPIAADGSDTAQRFICTSRMLDFLCNRFTVMFWDYVDRPLCSPVIDAITNEYNTYLAGLVSEGKLLSGTIEYVSDNNSIESLLAGQFRLDASVAGPIPAQRIDFYIDFDMEALRDAINV